MRFLARSALVVGGLGALGACSFDGGSSGQPDGPDAPPVVGVPDGPPPGAPDAEVAPPPDAAPPLTCPSAYDQEHAGHRYRFSSGKQTWRGAEDDCEADQPGDTHLIAIDDDAEWNALVVGAFASHFGEWQMIGVVRDLDDPKGPWRTVTGGDAPVLKWRGTFVPPSSEPNGNGDNEQPVVAIDPGFDLNHNPSAGGFIDVAPDFTAYFVCECDGRPPVDADYDD